MSIAPHSELTATGLPIDVRPGLPGVDSIDEVVPGIVVEPRTTEGVAATLAWASRHGLATVIRGSGTRIGWGRAPTRVDVVLCTRQLNRVLMNRPGDLTVAVEAGITLGDLNRELSAHGQLLPLDPSSGDRATIGGLLATGESGPLRHRFGAPRDLVIGIQLATTDGRITKAGGQVVKNVAGYDLSKLMCGSFGSLAAITGATFKLAPLPGASATVLAEGLDTGALVRLAGAAAASQLEPVAFDFQAAHGIPDGPRGASCAMRFWSFAAAIGPQVDAARACFASAGAEGVAIAGEDETRLWVRQAGGPNDGEGAIARVSWLPSELASMLQLLERLGGRGPVAMTGRIGAASGFIRIGGSESIQIAALEELRRTPPARHLVVVRASRAVKAAVDVWGVVPNAGLLDAIKRTLDPARILGAGRGPL